MTLALAVLAIVGTSRWAPLDLETPTLAAVFGGHLVHLGPRHLAWTAPTALLCAGLLERELGWRRFLAFLLASGLVVSGAVLALERDRLATYGGLSGVGHACLAAWAFRRPRWFSVLAIKVALEVARGDLVWDPGLDAGGVAVPTAHAAGVLAGMAYGMKTSFVATCPNPSREPPPGTTTAPPTVPAPVPCRGESMGASVVQESVAGS